MIDKIENEMTNKAKTGQFCEQLIYFIALIQNGHQDDEGNIYLVHRVAKC